MRDGDRLVILLAGGMKKRRQEDIRRARANWEDYRAIMASRDHLLGWFRGTENSRGGIQKCLSAARIGPPAAQVKSIG